MTNWKQLLIQPRNNQNSQRTTPSALIKMCSPNGKPETEGDAAFPSRFIIGVVGIIEQSWNPSCLAHEDNKLVKNNIFTICINKVWFPFTFFNLNPT